MDARKTLSKIYQTIRLIYKPKYILLNMGLAIAYYYLYTDLLKFQNHGIVLSVVPVYLLYALIITSSMVFTIAVYSISNMTKNAAHLSASSVGTFTALAGGIVGSCGCSAPVLFGLVSVGFSTSQVIVLNNFLSDFTLPLFIAFIIVNIIVEIYYLNKLADPKCRIKKRT